MSVKKPVALLINNLTRLDCCHLNGAVQTGKTVSADKTVFTHPAINTFRYKAAKLVLPFNRIRSRADDKSSVLRAGGWQFLTCVRDIAVPES